jgi:hypothetical protein
MRRPVRFGSQQRRQLCYVIHFVEVQHCVPQLLGPVSWNGQRTVIEEFGLHLLGGE